MGRIKAALTLLAASTCIAAASSAADPGKAIGSLTIDGKATKLEIAVTGTVENLFDEKKKDTLIVISDRPLGEIAPDDDIEMAMRARKGQLVALSLRIDGTKLDSVTIHAQALKDTIRLPGSWFTFKGGAGKPGALTLAKREWEGNAYACSVEFNAIPAKPKPAAKTATAPETPAKTKPAAEQPLPKASTSSIEPKAMAAMLVAAFMSKDEEQAYKLVKTGIDPNLRDQHGIPMLNWAVMMCMPKVVKALVDAGADLKYERAPGLTVLKEAGACPEAEKILRAAGAK